MLCPVCRKDYSLDYIGDHIDLCLLEINSVSKKTSQTPKRSFPYEGTNEINPSKKYKPTTVKNIMNMNQQRAISNKEHVPLAERMRPSCFDDYIGQEQVIGSNKVLRQLLLNGYVPSMILWGPPGCGKTSLANIISELCKEIHTDKVHIIKLSATSCGINNIRDAVKKAKTDSHGKRQTIVFMDEIHRFNKLQQDIFLPHVEAGTFTLIGTTTENPSYSLNSALLSRCRVFVLNKLTVQNVMEILYKAISFIGGEIYDFQDKSLSNNSKDKLSFSPEPHFSINETVIEWLAEISDGDARVALDGLELTVKTKVTDPSCFISITVEDVKESLQQIHMLSNTQTKNTHHLYFALHKSIKASKANASLYWLARIMAVKEDPVDIARRLVRISSEDVGLADPDALGVAVHTMHGCQMIGMPECDVLLAQCVVYLVRAPKCKLVHTALESAKNVIMNHEGPQPSVPLHIRDRSGQRKLNAILGNKGENLLHKEDNIDTHLPPGLQHVDFFLEDF